MAQQDFEELAENFEMLDDWEERYRYVIELGRELGDLDESKKTEATRVDGCVSRVWLDQRALDEPGGTRVEFDGDSDAFIVKGLIAILRTLLSGRRAEEIAAMDIEAELARIDLASHLSPQRSNGLRAMIERIRQFATAHMPARA